MKNRQPPGIEPGPLILAVSALPSELWPPGDSQPSQFSISHVHVIIPNFKYTTLQQEKRYLLEGEEVINHTQSHHCDALLLAQNRAEGEEERHTHPPPSWAEREREIKSHKIPSMCAMLSLDHVVYVAVYATQGAK